MSQDHKNYQELPRGSATETSQLEHLPPRGGNTHQPLMQDWGHIERRWPQKEDLPTSRREIGFPVKEPEGDYSLFGFLFSIISRLDKINGLLRTYLPRLAAEQERHTLLLEQQTERERHRDSWNMFWHILAFIVGNASALGSMILSFKGFLNQELAEVIIAATLTSSVVLGVQLAFRARRRRGSV